MLNKYTDELEKSRQEKDYQSDQYRKIEKEHHAKKVQAKEMQDDIENLGAQINSFYEKFKKAK